MLCIQLLLYSGLVQYRDYNRFYWLYLNYLILFQKNHRVLTLAHLATLALCIGPGGEITDIYSYFVSSALHLFVQEY